MYVHLTTLGEGMPRPTGTALVKSDLARGERCRRPAGSFVVKRVWAGEERYRIDGRAVTLRPGEVMVVPRQADTAVEIGGGGAKGACVYLSETLFAEAAGDVFGEGEVAPPRVLVMRPASLCAMGAAVAMLARASPEALVDAAAFHPVAAAAARACRDTAKGAARINAKSPSVRAEIFTRVERARAFLHAHQERPVSLDETARAAGMSGFHLSRAFRAAHGVSPIAYHRNVRLDWARSVLALKGADVVAVSEALGYSEVSAFSRAFRRRFDMPPSQIARTVNPSPRRRA